MTQPDKKHRKAKRRAVSIAAGTAAAAALGVGSLFNTADELLGGGDAPQASSQAAIVEVKELTRQPRGPAQKLRAFFLEQNAFVRGVVLLPLWAAGKALLTALSLLWTALSPYWGAILGVLINALLLLVVFIVAYKALFPDKNIRELFKKRRWLWILGGALLLGIIDAVCRRYFADYEAVSIFIKLFCGFFVLVMLSFKLFGHKIVKA